jgi:hypothetical protein
MRSRLLVLALATLMLILPGSPAHAIVNGVPDDEEHPFVGQLLFYVPDATDSRFDDPGAWYSCSGTLVNETTVVTAGHCTYGVGLDGESTTEEPEEGKYPVYDERPGSGGNDVWISFEEESDFSMLTPTSKFKSNENGDRYESWSAALDGSPKWHRATASTHPEYTDAAFYMHDAGVLELDEAVEIDEDEYEYGALPELGLLDKYAKDSKQRYTAVGYGLQESRPTGSLPGDNRRKAELKLIGLKGVYGLPDGVAAKFSSNNGKPHQGGTCFGDSGGPIFLKDGKDNNIIVAVTSFGMDPNCAAGGGGYRLDQPDDLDWFAEEFGLTP